MLHIDNEDVIPSINPLYQKINNKYRGKMGTWCRVVKYSCCKEKEI